MKTIVSPHVVKIKRDAGSYILYHALFGRPATVPRQLWDRIVRTHRGKAGRKGSFRGGEDIPQKALAIFKRWGFLVKKDTDEYALFAERTAARRKRAEAAMPSGGLIDKLRLEVTPLCNFRCRYCFAAKIYDREHNALMSVKTAQRAVDGFLRTLKANGKKSGEITYWGGEPLLNWPVIRRTVEYAEQAGKACGIRVSHGFVTNGSLITDDVAAFMTRHSMGATVSLDGLGQDNDRLRRYASGKGTFNDIIRGMDFFSKHGVYFWVEITLHDHNFHGVEKLIDFVHKKYKVWTFIITPVHYEKTLSSFNRHNALAKAKRMVEIYRYAAAKHLRASIENFSMVNDLIAGTPHLFTCAGKSASFYVKPDGSIYPCQKIITRTGHVRRMGDVTRGRRYRHVASRGIDKITTCRGCDIEGFCAGGCAGLVQFYSGDIYDTSKRKFRKIHCAYRRHLLKETLKYLSR